MLDVTHGRWGGETVTTVQAICVMRWVPGGALIERSTGSMTGSQAQMAGVHAAEATGVDDGVCMARKGPTCMGGIVSCSDWCPCVGVLPWDERGLYV